MRKRAAIYGATGLVGRRLTGLLVDHPWFEPVVLIGSSMTVGKPFNEVWKVKEEDLCAYYGSSLWQLFDAPASLCDHIVQGIESINAVEVDLVFSSVPERASDGEDSLLDLGVPVFSNSPHRRFDPQVPLIVPEVNGADVTRSTLIKNPNCVTSGLVIALAPIDQAYGLKHVSVTTFQSLSGRGDAKYRHDLVMGNVYPLHRSDERTEDNIRREVHKILGRTIPVSVRCHRVPVQEGHLVDVRVTTSRPIKTRADMIDLWNAFNPLTGLALPTNPRTPLVVIDEIGRPRPRQDIWHHDGMSIAIGSISTTDEVFDLTFTYVVNNVIRGAAGGALLNAELYFARQDGIC